MVSNPCWGGERNGARTGVQGDPSEELARRPADLGRELHLRARVGEGKGDRGDYRSLADRVGEGAQARGLNRPHLPLRSWLVCRRRRPVRQRLPRLDEWASSRNLCRVCWADDPLWRQEVVGDIELPAAIVRSAQPQWKPGARRVRKARVEVKDRLQLLGGS